MSQEEFKHYLDMVVEKAFKEGIIWKTNGQSVLSMDEAIKEAQRKILEGN